MHLWHNACKSQQSCQQKGKKYRKHERKTTSNVNLVDIKSLSFESDDSGKQTE